MVPVAMRVADDLAREGIEAEVVDPRTLVPLDMATIMRSVVQTGRLVTVEEGALNHHFGAEIHCSGGGERAPGAQRAPAACGRDRRAHPLCS